MTNKSRNTHTPPPTGVTVTRTLRLMMKVTFEGEQSHVGSKKTEHVNSEGGKYPIEIQEEADVVSLVVFIGVPSGSVHPCIFPFACSRSRNVIEGKKGPLYRSNKIPILHFMTTVDANFCACVQAVQIISANNRHPCGIADHVESIQKNFKEGKTVHITHFNYSPIPDITLHVNPFVLTDSSARQITLVIHSYLGDGPSIEQSESEWQRTVLATRDNGHHHHQLNHVLHSVDITIKFDAAVSCSQSVDLPDHVAMYLRHSGNIDTHPHCKGTMEIIDSTCHKMSITYHSGK